MKLELNILICQTETTARTDVRPYLEQWDNVLSTFGKSDEIDIVQFPEMAFTEYVYKDKQEVEPILEE